MTQKILPINYEELTTNKRVQKLIAHAASLLDRSPAFAKANVQLYELNQRFLWFIAARCGVIVTFIVIAFSRQILLPYIDVSSHVFLLMALFLTAANVAYWMHYKYSKNVEAPAAYSKRISINVQVQIIFDFFVLGYLVYRCGGIESPLVYFFLFHNVISCLFFRKVVSFAHTLLSLGIIYFISLLPFFGYAAAHHFIFPQAAEAFFNKPAVYVYYLAGISAVFLTVWLCVAGITDSLKSHEKWLQDKIDELLAMEEERTRYLLVTTHELKAPFSAIQSYVNVLLGGYAGELSQKVREVLSKIKTRCDVLMKMITQMLQLANLNSLQERKGNMITAQIDVIKVFEKVVDDVRLTAADKGVTISLPKNRICRIPANEEQLDMLFNNILSNAISYCYPNTEIAVEAHETPQALTVTVADCGIGIKRKDLENVFLEYFRSEEAAQMNKSSTGLGLAIARQVMELHNGRIWLESEEKVGTTVFLTFAKPKKGRTQ